MSSHGNLLAFLAAWFAAVGAAFFLSNLEGFAAVQDCSYCTLCAQYNFADIYDCAEGTAFVAEGFFSPGTGASVPQAFTCGGCQDNSCWCFQSQGCNITGCVLDETSATITYKYYNTVNFPCNIPAGSQIGIREFTGGTVYKTGSTPQDACPTS